MFFQPEYYKDAPHFRSVIGNESEYRLEIPHAKLDYTGTYSVIATNCYGQAKAIISLQIYAKGMYVEYFVSVCLQFQYGIFYHPDLNFCLLSSCFFCCLAHFLVNWMVIKNKLKVCCFFNMFWQIDS